MLYIYIVICAAMIAFNIIFIFASKIYPYALKFYTNYFYKRFLVLSDKFTKNGSIGACSVFIIKHLLVRSFALMALDGLLDKLKAKEMDKAHEMIRGEFFVIQYLCEKFLKQSPRKMAYFLNILYKYNICEFRSDDEVLKIIKKYLYMPSLYCRYNAMRILYATGDVKKVIEGVEIINKSDAYTHERVLSVGFQSFTGDKDELLKKLINGFYNYKEWIQEAICNFAPTVSGNYQKEMFEFLKDESLSDSIHILCIGYLGLFPYKDAYGYLIDCLKDTDKTKVRYAEYAAKYLYAYPCAETIFALKQAMFSDKWVVQINAADSLEKLGLEYNDLLEIFNGNDRYAMDIMQYFLDVRKLTSDKKDECGGKLYGRSI